MKTKQQHFKENILPIIFFNIYHYLVIIFIFSFIEMNIVYKLFAISYLFLDRMFTTADKLYADYLISEIEKEVKSLKNNSL